MSALGRPVFEPQVLRSASPTDVEGELRRLHPGIAITHGFNESVVEGFVNDVEWNSMDLWHRVFVHRTYREHLPVFSGAHFALNVTRLGRTPFFAQIANAKISPGLLYQTMTMWGVFYLHQIVRLTQEGEKVRIRVDWWIASHPLFRWLHRPFNWRLTKLQLVQDAEDAEIRARRFALRRTGFRFTTDEPDFVNASDLGDHVVAPVLAAPRRLSLSRLPLGRIERRVEASCELLVERGEDGVRVWPGLCPHEGAAIGPEHLCDGVARCPWHGRRFPAAVLSPAGRREWRYLDWRVALEGDDLVVSSAGAGRGSAGRATA